ncbi:MAG: hypothetical protein R3A12_17275 [Ignavibacteria bacterium]
MGFRFSIRQNMGSGTPGTILLYSSNGGNNWIQQPSNSYTVNNIQMINSTWRI